MSTCMSKKTNVQIIRSRNACNSKIQTTALWQRPVGPPVAPSITSVAMELLGTATLNIAPPKTDGGARVTSYIVTSSPGQVRATFKPDQIKAAKISGLIPGNTYSFSVVAVNSKGPSPASLATSPARAPIPVPVPTPQPVQQPVPLPIQVSEPVPVPVPTPTPTPTLRAISSPAIVGVIAPVTGARPVTATTAGTGYTGTVTWSGTPRFFASVTTYTATITLTATSGYTLTGVSANYFTVAGATSITHSANSGVITAVFPATSLSIPVFTLTSSLETRTVNSVATGFTVDSTGDAIDSFSITPSAPAGMSFNTTTGEFTGTPTSIADAIDYTITATNAVGSATRTFTFAVTAPITISNAPIGGVAAPVTGRDPARTTTAGKGYTGTVAWSGSPKLFAAVTTYTATITLTPLAGFTLTGVTANFFTVAGATSVTHSADSGVITAVFPATAKLSQTITFDTPSAMTVGGSTQTVAPTASSSLTVTLTSTTTGICTVAEFVITAVASGTCSITASQAGNANYEAAPDVIKTFATKATQSITFTFFPADISFGTNPAGLGAISTSTLTVAFTTATSGVCTVSGTTVTIVSVGTCTINANQAGNVNFEPASQVAQSFTIAKATPNLSSFANVSKTVGDASFSLTAPTVANSLPGSFTYTSATTATATISGTTITLGSAGTTVITATFTPTDTANYNSATITMTLTVSTATCAEGGVCAVGDRGPGGGYVFYVSATNFTSTGSTCNTSCKYLEVAPSYWQNNYPENDPSLVLQYEDGGGINQVDQNFGDSTEGFNDNEKVNWRIGQGFYNTSLFTGPAAAAVLAYAGNSSAGQWFIPSMNELNELCKYVNGQATGNPKDICSYEGNFKETSKVGNSEGKGGFVRDFYWSSSQHYQTSPWVWIQKFSINNQQVASSKWVTYRIRPIRAFGP